MSHLVLGSNYLGFHISKAIEEAKALTVEHETVEFEFNGIKCVVNKDTIPEYLERDFMNAHIMEWGQVGPECVPWYDTDTEIDLYTRKLANAKKKKQEEIECDAKSAKEKASFNEKVNGLTIELKDESGWLEGKSKNTDPYGACIYEYAEGWAKLMQVQMAKGIRLVDCAAPTSYELGFLGITGFMYGAAVSVLSHCWKYGEELRKWHNKEYKHEGDGVVNPAILTIKD